MLRCLKDQERCIYSRTLMLFFLSLLLVECSQDRNKGERSLGIYRSKIEEALQLNYILLFESNKLLA